MSPGPDEPPPVDGPQEWTCVYRARTLLEADLLAASLRAEGLEATVDLPNVNAILDGALSFTMPGGVAVLVPPAQAEEAVAIVREYEARAKARAAKPDQDDEDVAAGEPAG